MKPRWKGRGKELSSRVDLVQSHRSGTVYFDRLLPKAAIPVAGDVLSFETRLFTVQRSASSLRQHGGGNLSCRQPIRSLSPVREM